VVQEEEKGKGEREEKKKNKLVFQRHGAVGLTKETERLEAPCLWWFGLFFFLVLYLP
jgi:hypothetical protein